jgi:serine/threonine protein phosphatase PrpC
MKEFVIALPHLTEVNLSEQGSCPFMILACDGLWDVMSDQEAIEIVLEETKKNNGPHEGIAEFLVCCLSFTLHLSFLP